MNKHAGLEDRLFKKCAHGIIEPRKWLKAGIFCTQFLSYSIHDSVLKNLHLHTRPITEGISFPIRTAVYDKLSAGLTNNALVKGIKEASPLAQTSCLQGFHSVLNHFTPKMIANSYISTYCNRRLTCDLIHFITLDLLTEVYRRSYRVNSSHPLPLMLL